MQCVNQQTFEFLQNLDSLHCILVLTTHGREQSVSVRAVPELIVGGGEAGEVVIFAAM